MRFLSWAVYYEGPSDALYLDVLIPRIINDLVVREGTDLIEVPEVPAIRMGQEDRSVEGVAKEACKARAAFDIVFIHADTGGRGVAKTLPARTAGYCKAMHELCDWPPNRCISVTPCHETEAWLLADGRAILEALGYNGDLADVGLPANASAAERLNDPKQTLRSAIEQIAGRRRSQNIDRLFPAIAQRQSLETLRGSNSFQSFENRLRGSLRDLHYLK